MYNLKPSKEFAGEFTSYCDPLWWRGMLLTSIGIAARLQVGRRKEPRFLRERKIAFEEIVRGPRSSAS
jgi:hypothetical protein